MQPRRSALAMLALAATCALVITATPAHAAERERLLVLDAKGALDDGERKALTQLVTARIAERAKSVEVIAGADVRTLADVAGEQSEAGCDTDACLAELAGALDARYVVSTDVNKLGEVYVVALALFDAKAARTLSRRAVEARDTNAAARAASDAIDGIVAEAFADVGGARTSASTGARSGTLGVALGGLNAVRLSWPLGPVDVVGHGGLGLAVQQQEAQDARFAVASSGVNVALTLAGAFDVVVPFAITDSVAAFAGLGAQVGNAGVGYVRIDDAFRAGLVFLARVPVGARFVLAEQRVELTAEIAPAVVLGGALGVVAEPTLAAAYRF